MGLREKVALAMLVSISTQIVCNYCMLRSDSICPLKTCTKNAKSPELFRFPDVEYPSDYEAEEYYRFLSDYHHPNICSNSFSPQSQNHEREPKFKRKYDVATNIKAKPEITNSFTECDSLSHPYCFRKSSFFPEVEYPLSARDTWIPTYWSRLQDARRNSNLQKDIPSLSSTTTQTSNYDTDYTNSPLSSLIKTLNTKKKSSSAMPISDTDYSLPIPNEVDTCAVKNAFDIGGIISSNINPDISIPEKDTTVSTKNTAYSDVNPESVIPTKNMICDILTSTTNTKNNGSNLYIPGEGNINDFVSTAKTATHSHVSLEPPVSNKAQLNQVVATPIENNNPDSYSPGEGIQNNTVPTITQASNSDISFGPSVINNDLLDYIVATSSGESPVTMNDPLGDIVPSKNKTKNNNIIPEVPQLTEGTAPVDNIVPTMTHATDSVIQSNSSMSKNDLLGDIMTSTTNTKNGNIPIIKEDKRLCISNASTIMKTKSDIKPETTISKNDPLGDIVTTLSTTYAKTSEVIPKHPIPNIPIEDKDLIDNNVSITISPTNRPTNPGTFISQNEPLDDIVKLTNNTKTSDIMPELPTVSTITTPMNNDATPDTFITKNDPRDTCFESNSTMTTTALPILTMPMTNNSSDFSPTQTLPKEDQSFDGICTSTTTKATQTTVEIHSGQFSNKEALMSSSDMTSMASSNTNSIRTTPSPLEFINPNNDIQANNFNAGNSQSNTGPSKLTNDWIMNQNIWQTVPEYSSDWIAYVENENALPTRGKFCDEIFIVGGTKKCENSASPSTNTDKDNSGYIMLPTVPDYLDDSWLLLYDTGNTTQDLAPNGFEPVYFSVESNTNEGSIPGANDTMSLIVFMDDPNSTLKYEYVDDASVSCTEMPYDLVVYPEYVNDIWSASTNDSYVLYQPICDYSDDICLLFIDTNGTIPSGDII